MTEMELFPKRLLIQQGRTSGQSLGSPGWSPRPGIWTQQGRDLPTTQPQPGSQGGYSLSLTVPLDFDSGLAPQQRPSYRGLLEAGLGQDREARFRAEQAEA